MKNTLTAVLAIFISTTSVADSVDLTLTKKPSFSEEGTHITTTKGRLSLQTLMIPKAAMTVIDKAAKGDCLTFTFNGPLSDSNIQSVQKCSATSAKNKFSSAPSYDKKFTTRHGEVTINEDKVLLFKGKPLKPSIEGNSGLSIIGKYQDGAKDLLVIQDTGGSGCPAQFQMLTVTASQIVASKPFGTCSDLIQIVQEGSIVVISMPGFMGPFESRTARNQAATEVHIFKIAGLQVAETVRK